MLLSQVRDNDGRTAVVLREGTEAYRLRGFQTVYDLVCDCIERGVTISARIQSLGFGAVIDLEQCYLEGRVLPPLTHPEPSRLYLTCAGNDDRDGAEGTGPDWYYKGNGDSLVAPGMDLPPPRPTHEAAEEPELAGLYVIGTDGAPFRLGFALANEFVASDGANAPSARSRLRPASVGPELRLGSLPRDVIGVSRIRRGTAIVHERRFHTGEATMTHDIAMLEGTHFCYDAFRRPGDVHIHIFGGVVSSHGEEFRSEPGDIFEIEADGFGLPLRNPLGPALAATGQRAIAVTPL
ncbi:GguC protein [Pelagovum pacificum]|uniref:GguC protein n=1 Tax=Pelagovum pacificum TaxID=2588711 RepID=A0A5C5G8G9_9RHOB|nr:GguC protein [Pelagovum pacificum]QQA41709.1 GguC protein [Pelagovum pacificum]TNY30986.1 GguC protein [Pelagovum pacificum]